jgi:uncharacterized ubiquitin-like protein YukD
MNNISGFFKKIGEAQAKEIALRASIQAAIKEFIDIDVPIHSITIKSRVATIKRVEHGARSNLYIYKQKIIERANAEIPTKDKIRDIK